jgi:hypothetical protein
MPNDIKLIATLPSIIVLNVIMLNATMPSIVVLNVIMLNAIIISVFILSIIVMNAIMEMQYRDAKKSLSESKHASLFKPNRQKMFNIIFACRR